MEALEALRAVIRARRSVRRGYTDRPVAREVLLDLVEAAVYAPSGSNSQDIRFAVETRPEAIARLASIRRDADGVLAQARALILVFVDLRLRKPGPIWAQLAYQDAAAAIQNVLLLATAHGLGSCWISAYRNMELTPHLSRQTWAQVLAPMESDHLEIMGIVALGHTAGAPQGDASHRGHPVARRPVLDYVLALDGNLHPSSPVLP